MNKLFQAHPLPWRFSEAVDVDDRNYPIDYVYDATGGYVMDTLDFAYCRELVEFVNLMWRQDQA